MYTEQASASFVLGSQDLLQNYLTKKMLTLCMMGRVVKSHSVLLLATMSVFSHGGEKKEGKG
jgi:hypothetical protein